MKTKKLFVCIAAGALICLAGCGSKNGGRFDALNEMLAADYTEIVVTVTNTFDGGSTLTGNYTVTQTAEGKKVEYSVERFDEISLEGSQGTKITLTGTAIVKDGEIVSTTGDEMDLPAGIEGGFTFSADCFSNAVFGEGSMEADVKNASKFFGTAVLCTDMKVEAEFQEVLTSLRIGYTATDGTAVEYVYAFTA